MPNSIPKRVERLAKWLINLSRTSKRKLMVSADAVCIPLVLWAAITLRLGTVQHNNIGHFFLYVIAVIAAVPAFIRLGLYRAVVRYLGPRAFLTGTIGVSASVLILGLVNATFQGSRIPWSALGIYWALALLYVSGSRFIAAALMNYRSVSLTQRVAIYGAGEAGAELARSLRRSGRFNPVVFVDDNETLQGSTVIGMEVLSASRLPQVICDEEISAVLLALPSLSRRRRYEILKQLEPLGVLVQTVPDYGDIIAGNAKVDDVRDVDANDLLGRDPVAPDEALLGACIRGKVVMVSGAGGSIGSELCRQILQLGPTRLVLFELSEVALYSIERELRLLSSRQGLEVEIIALLGNSHHQQRMCEIIKSCGVQTIYHAAAYKHVPIVEQNIVEGIHNNIFGTWYAAEAAAEAKVETFVLVSTDKAVNPSNVMGATKRFAEIVLQGLHERGTTTRFCMVRFGNVLESSGSVVPLFREQIKNGGPITVTHKDVIRYFMTIPEAAQLVIQAGSMAKGGDVFVLDMGQPVRIRDLAGRMVKLMGLTLRDEDNPDGDIEIVYTGLRPAEKLYEELLIGNNVTGTQHPRIMRAMEHHLSWSLVEEALEKLLEATNGFDCTRARELLMEAVAEYQPGQDIQDLVWTHKRQAMPLESKKVTDFASHRARHGH